MAWELTGEPLVGIRASKMNLVSLAFSPDSRTLAAAGLGGDISIWALPSGERIATLSGHQTAVMSLVFAHRGRSLVSLGYEQEVRFWDTGTWRAARVLQVPGVGARGLVLSPDERTAAVTVEGRVQLWAVADWSLEAELPVSVKALYGTTFSPDSHWLATGAADGNIRVWDFTR